MLAWTVVLGLVFSAGLITGQRLLRADAHGPMVSLSSTALAKSRSATNGDAAKPLRTTFSFYEHLTSSKEASAEPAPDVEEPPTVEEVPAAKPVEEAADEKPVEEAPAEKPADEAPVEEVPAEKVPAQEAPVEKVAEAPAERRAPDRVIDELVDAVRGEPEEGTPAEESKPALPARYTLQVSSHPDRASAEREMTRLRDVGLEPHVISVDVPGRGKLWRIRIGKFHSMNEARSFQGSLDQKRGVAGFVTPL